MELEEALSREVLEDAKKSHLECASQENQPATAHVLYQLWEELVAPGGRGVPLKFEVKSRLSAFEKHVGTEDAPGVLTSAAKHWDWFGYRANYPNDFTIQPSSQSLLDYWPAAVMTYIDGLPNSIKATSWQSQKEREAIIIVLEKGGWASVESLRMAIAEGNVRALAEKVGHLPSKLKWDGVLFQIL
jgi:hypothetical protein